MNQYILDGFKKEMEKRAGLASAALKPLSWAAKKFMGSSLGTKLNIGFGTTAAVSGAQKTSRAAAPGAYVP
jgi:hypothetical protein